MSHFLEEESPWGQPAVGADTYGNGGFIDEDDEVSPWAQASEADGDEGHHSVAIGSDKPHDFYTSSGFEDPSLPLEQSVFAPYGNTQPEHPTEDEAGTNGSLAGLVSQKSNPDLAFVKQDADQPDSAKPAAKNKSPRRKGRVIRAVKTESVDATPLGPLDDPLGPVTTKSTSTASRKSDGDELHDISLAMSTQSLDDPLRSALGSEATVSSQKPTAEIGSTTNYRNSALHKPDETANSYLSWSTANVLTGSDDPRSETARSSVRFDIHVSDPSKVGELTNQYTVYTVNTDTDMPDYEQKQASVLRRYRDFRWLFRALEHNHPGIIVPPPPDKQAVGRFNDDFVEQRRTALEQMLRKITAHPLLQADRDIKAFLTDDDFAEYLKNRLLSYEELDAAQQVPPEPTGFMNAILGKGGEPDGWLVQRRNRLDAVETQLRGVYKALDAVSIQRKELSDAVGDFANATEALANVEPTRRLGEVLRAFGQVQEQLSRLYSRQRQQDMLTLEATLDEHIRLIGSARDALSSRQRIAAQAEATSLELEKKQATLDKLRRQGRSQEDRHAALESEVAQLSERGQAIHQQAADVAHRVDAELQRLDKEKMKEFRNAVELYLENAIEAQKEAIETWETFYTQHFSPKPDA